MTAPLSTKGTRVLLSFSSAYAELARRIEKDLVTANIEVRFDKWEGGGGVPATQSVAASLDDVSFVLPLLTPSDVAATWIGDEWKRSIHDEAGARNIEVLPVRGDGELDAVPDFLRKRSFADMREGRYAGELRRLVETIRDRSGNAEIQLPDGGRAADAAYSPMTLAANPLTLEVGATLASAVLGHEKTNPFDEEMLPMMYDGLFYELGVRFPRLHLQVSSDLPPSSARFVINDVPELQVEVRPDSVMVNDSVAAMVERGFVAEATVNPATSAASAWIPIRQAATARDRGLITWNASEFLILALSSVLRRKAAHFIGIDETQAMLEQIRPVFPKLVAEAVPKTVSLFVLTDVLRRLVAELVSIRNLRQILIAIGDWARVEPDPLMLTEYVRAALKRQITHMFSRGTNVLIVFLLDPELESLIRDSTRFVPTGSYVDLAPDRLRGILDAIQKELDAVPDNFQVPQILTTTEIRSSVRRLVAPSMPGLHVVSYQELRQDVNIQPIARISRAGVSTGGVPLWADTVDLQDRG